MTWLPGLVLDTDALLAYAEGGASVNVGEWMVGVADRGQSVVIPAACLASAYQQVTDAGRDYLDIVGDLAYTVVAPLAHEHCSVLGGLSRTLGLATGQAVLEVANYPLVPLMTAHRDLVTQFLPKEWPIIDV